MRKSTLLLIAVMSAQVARAGFSAGGGDDDRPTPTPVENLYFTTDEFIYVPNFTTTMGFRVLTGGKASFSGVSLIESSSYSRGDATGVYLVRTYYDGTVGLDTRSNADGSAMKSADGLTSTFYYSNATQGTDAPGYVSYHFYTAQVYDTVAHTKDADASSGVELTMSKDLPQWLGKHIQLKLTGGIGLNGIRAEMIRKVPSVLETTTDLYSLYGAAAPGITYSSGGTTSTLSYTGPDGSPVSFTQTQSTLLSAQPSSRTVTSANSDTAVTDVYHVHGAYYTLRVGPTFIVPFTDSFRFTVSAGLMALYSSTNFEVQEMFEPYDGETVARSVTASRNKILPGAYFDANLEYWVSDKTGFYAGAAYQMGGTYKQSVYNDTSYYSTTIDLKSLSGLRAGMNIRF